MIEDYTFINPSESRLECGRCKSTEPYKLPIGCEEFAKRMRAFAKAHQTCQAPPRKPTTVPMTEYEIINPSDVCFIKGTDLEAICAAGVFLGRGLYGLNHAETGEKLLPMFSFDGPGAMDAWWRERFGSTFDEYMDTWPQLKIAEVLETFRYKVERTSLNNIGKEAKVLAEKLRLRHREKAACGGGT